MAANLFKYIFVNENGYILIKVSLKYVLKDPIDSISAFR